MSDSCSGPGCAFRQTYLAATALGAGIAMLAIAGGKSVDLGSGVLFVLVLGLSAHELWTGPVSLWFRTLVGTAALAFVVGIVGVGAAEQFLSGIAHSVVFVGVLLGGMWVVPRAVEELSLGAVDAGEPSEPSA
jgi:hypothetical protein